MKKFLTLTSAVALLALGSAVYAAPAITHCQVNLNGSPVNCTASSHFPPTIEIRSNVALNTSDKYLLQCSASGGDVLNVNAASGLKYSVASQTFKVSGTPNNGGSTFIATVLTDSDHYTISNCVFKDISKK